MLDCQRGFFLVDVMKSAKFPVMSDSWSEGLKKFFIQDEPLLIIIHGALGPLFEWPKTIGNWGEISPLRALRIQICPKKRISPIILLILFWGWDRDHQSYSREGSGFLETWNCGPLLITGRGAHLVGYPAPREPFLGAAVEEVGSAEWVKCRLPEVTGTCGGFVFSADKPPSISKGTYYLPWEPKTFIFRGCNPYIGGLKPSFFMVLGSKGSDYMTRQIQMGSSLFGKTF